MKLVKGYNKRDPNNLNKNKQVRIKKQSELIIIIIASLFFVGIFTIIFYGTKTLISWNTIVRIYLTAALILSFFPTKFLPLIFKLKREVKLLMAICGAAPFIIGFSIMINYKTAKFKRTESYKIKNSKTYYSEGIIIVNLENNELIKHRELLKFSLDKSQFVPDSAVYEISEGILGLEVVSDSYLSKKED